MHKISPLGTRLKRHVGDVEIAVTYSAATASQMTVTVELTHHVQEKAPQPASWLRHLWPRDEAAPPAPNRAAPMLGYVQMLGFARINHQIGADTAGDSSQSAYWRDAEYAATYVAPDTDDNVGAVLSTPFFQAPPHTASGLTDISAGAIDADNYASLRDVVHPYTADAAPRDCAHVTDAHRAEIAASVARFVRPFYVSAQHLLFARAELVPGTTQKYCIQCNLPGPACPPSYNTRSTGSLGDGGLASLVYAFVVGFSEEVSSEMKQRAVYFPMEMRGENRCAHDFLDHVQVDTGWRPRPVSEPPASEPPAPAAEDDIGYATFLADLNRLINATPENVAARERRMSSVSDTTAPTGSPRTSYQIRVNNANLCLLTLASASVVAGAELSFFLRSTAHRSGPAHSAPRIVGYAAHVEAHEIFHLATGRKLVHVYKVTPTLKDNTYAEAMVQDFSAGVQDGSGGLCNSIHVPAHVTQQFSAPSFMDLRYFLVFRFVVGEFGGDSHTTDDYVQARTAEAAGSDFTFSVPVAVLP